MGTIVINQTDCKQNIVLHSSLDGVSGGYYDQAGIWHEFGGLEFKRYKIKKNTIPNETDGNILRPVYGYILDWYGEGVNAPITHVTYNRTTPSKCGSTCTILKEDRTGTSSQLLNDTADGAVNTGVENTIFELIIPEESSELLEKNFEEITE